MRVRRNFAFVDLSGFSALTEAQGDERAVSVLGAFRTQVRDICSRRGVRIAKWLGDGAMLVAVDAGPMLAATLEMQHAVAAAHLPTPLRCGVSAGEVILLEGDDYIGHPVNLASRLCELSPDGAVLATDAGPELNPGRVALVAYLPRWGVVQSTGEMTVRGLERPLTVAHLGLRELEGPAIPDPVCGIPLTREVSEATAVDGLGQEVWFCSESCRDTWEQRPRPVTDAQGSPRTPLIGS